MLSGHPLAAEGAQAAPARPATPAKHDADGKYISEQQQRGFALIRALAGNETTGLAPGEIARLLSCSPSQVTRDLANLRHIGWAESLPTGRWRLGRTTFFTLPTHATTASRYSRSRASS